MKREFEALAYDTLIFGVRDMGESLKRLSEFVRQPVSAVITFNNLGFNMELSEGENVWEQLAIPCVNILIDHPFKTTEQALEETLLAVGIELEEWRLKDVISDLHFVDLYAVSYYREKTVRTVAESGIPITLYGAGWENCEWIGRSNVFYGGKISANDVVAKMADTKIVLSTMTWFKDGTHDRVFNGMLQGAVTASDTSLYMKEEFCGAISEGGEDRREMILFELGEIECLPGQIRELLENPWKAQQIADRGYAKAKAHHTWQARAMELDEELLGHLCGR